MSVKPCKRGHTERYANGECKDCNRAQMRDYYQRTKGQRRDYVRTAMVKGQTKKEYSYRYHLLRTYGVTPEQYDAMFTAQNGRCAICRCDDPGSVLKRWHIDHCHDTGSVRGILCAQCNVMIAMAREDARILSAGIRYLEAANAADQIR